MCLYVLLSAQNSDFTLREEARRMDNIEIKTSMLSSEESSKPDPDLPTEDAPADDGPSPLSDVQARLAISTWEIVKSRVSLEDAGIILFTK